MSVLAIVRREAERLARLALVPRMVLPLAVILGVLTAAAGWLDDGRWLALPPFLPALSWTVGILGAVLLARFLQRRLARRTAPAAIATAIEDEQGLRRGALTGLLEVAGSGVFAEHAAEALGTSLATAAARPAPRHRRRLVRAALLSAFAFVQLGALAGTSWARRPDGWQVLLHPVDAWRGALVEPLRIVDAPSRALRGASLALDVAAPGRRTVQVRWRATGSDWQQAVTAVDVAGRAAVQIPNVEADLVIIATDGRAGYDSVTVRVVDRPFVGDISLTARYPAYLSRAPERLPADAPLRIPAGTVLDITGAASEALARVTLQAERQQVALEARGTRFSGRLVPQASAVWRWDVAGAAQPILDVPAPLEIEVVSDSVPRAEILAPTGEVLVEPDVRITLDLLAQDDHALTRVALRVRRVAGAAAGGAGAPSAGRAGAAGARESLLSERRESLWSGTATVDLQPLDLRPGDAVEVVLVACDAAPGAREGVSTPVLLRVPTAAQAREAAREAADAAVSAAESAARAQAELAEQTATEARTRSDRGNEASGGQQERREQSTPEAQAAGNPAAGARDNLAYESAERAREIADRQRDLQRQVEQLEDAARELEDRLRSAGALDTALARQLQDAQRMLRDAMTPEMQRALQQMEQATQQLDAPRTRQSMQELAQQQQRMRETLERSAEMLRRAALEGQMQTLADQSRELSERQRARADSLSAGAQPSPQERQRTQREAEQLARAAEQLAERLLQAKAEPGAERMQQGAQAAREAAQQMQREAGDPSAANQAAESMERAAESLEGARRDQVSQWKSELTEAIDRSVQELMQMAREQDALAQQARQEADAGAMRSAQSALQQGVQAAQERLEEESRKSTLVSPRSQELMGRAQQRSAQATREAAEGRRGQAEQAMREAADALRQAAAQLTRDRERATQARSATGMAELLEQLQQLAQQQGGLNSEMQSLLPMAQRQGGAAGQNEALQQQARQLARQQREVAQRLDDVSDADPTGRAQELAREARALAAALDQGAVDPATQARQERLFQRMLDAGRSLEQDQRDESQRREARAARRYDRITPRGDGRGEAAERYPVPTWEELRGLSAEDRRLVIEYFRRLNRGGTP